MPSEVIEPPLTPPPDDPAPEADRGSRAGEPGPEELSDDEVRALPEPQVAPKPPAFEAPGKPPSTWEMLGISTNPQKPETAPGGASSFSAFDVPTTTALGSSRSSTTTDELLDGSRRSWPLLLLSSYASAVTLGLLWVLWQERNRPQPKADGAPTTTSDAGFDNGRRAGASRRLAPLPSLPDEQQTTLGKPVNIGVLEVVPIAVTRGRIILKRLVNPVQVHEAGRNALKLRLQLRNTSNDVVLAPLDEAFLRARDPSECETFIDVGHGRRIDMLPLAIESEWTIVGQSFRELGPGETYETQIVTAPDALSRTVPEMIWRIKLRTGINQASILGVRFSKSEIQPER